MTNFGKTLKKFCLGYPDHRLARGRSLTLIYALMDPKLKGDHFIGVSPTLPTYDPDYTSTKIFVLNLYLFDQIYSNKIKKYMYYFVVVSRSGSGQN